jgi:isohexenylglutaconyl-CoA hydratase
MSIELAEFSTLAVMRQGGVLHVTLNRPAQRNAMSLAMVRELRVVLAQAEMKGEVRVIVLRGAGGHFCAGADVADLASARARLADHVNPAAQAVAHRVHEARRARSRRSQKTVPIFISLAAGPIDTVSDPD